MCLFHQKLSKINLVFWNRNFDHHSIFHSDLSSACTNLVNFFCLQQIISQTMKRKEVTLVVLNCRKKLRKRFWKRVDLILLNFFKHMYTIRLPLLAYNFNKLRIPYKHTTCIPRWNVVSTSFSVHYGIHVVRL